MALFGLFDFLINNPAIREAFFPETSRPMSNAREPETAEIRRLPLNTKAARPH